MSLRIIDCEQGSYEWFIARAGIPTASRFNDVISKGRGSAPSKTRATYMRELAGERLLGEPADIFEGNRHTERGHRLEPEVRAWYEMRTDRTLRTVGFALDDTLRAGASPDSLVDDEGLLEIKTKLPKLQIELLLEGGVLPEEHKAQAQGQLMVTGRKWLDFVSYCERLPVLLVRVERDEPYIAALRIALQDFNSELDQMVATIEAMK